MIFSESRLWMAMQGRDLMLRVGAQESIDIFEEPKNKRIFLDLEVYKKINFIQSRLYMAMQGCDLVLRIGAQKLI